MTNEESYVNIEPSNPVQTVAPEKEETELIRATDKITALYCRLSNEDSLDGEVTASRISAASSATTYENKKLPKPVSSSTTDTVEPILIVPAFRKCWMRSKRIMWRSC